MRAFDYLMKMRSTVKYGSFAISSNNPLFISIDISYTLSFAGETIGGLENEFELVVYNCILYNLLLEDFIPFLLSLVAFR